MKAKGQDDESNPYIIDGWKGYVPALPAFKSGHQEFKLVYEDGRLIESVEVPTSAPTAAASSAPGVLPVPAAPQDGWLSMRQAAGKMRRSYSWFSRNWRGMGFHPTAGRPLLFEEKEIEGYLQGHRVRRSRGRPRKA